LPDANDEGEGEDEGAVADALCGFIGGGVGDHCIGEASS